MVQNPESANMMEAGMAKSQFVVQSEGVSKLPFTESLS